MVKFRVDDIEIEAEEGTVLLQACLANGIYIPNLCHIEGCTASASCRMCFVEIEGETRPALSCTVPVRPAMVVKTDTPEVRQLQRTAFRLLLSVHHVDCKNCPANKRCELQRMAGFLKTGLKPKPLDRFLKEAGEDQTHPFLKLHPNRCVLCGRCVHVCRKQHGQSMLTFAKRGFETRIVAYGEDDPASFSCSTCSACLNICPVAAITLQEDAGPL